MSSNRIKIPSCTTRIVDYVWYVNMRYYVSITENKILQWRKIHKYNAVQHNLLGILTS